MWVRDKQPQKAHAPIAITWSGMVTLVNEEQPLKAQGAIVLREFGNVMFARDVQS